MKDLSGVFREQPTVRSPGTGVLGRWLVVALAWAGPVFVGSWLSPVASAEGRLFDTSATSTIGMYPEGFYPHDSRAADLNADGAPDYIATNHWYPSNVSIALNDRNGGFLPPAFLNIGGPSIGVEVADFTGDGLPDILASNTGANHEGSSVSLLRNLGNGAFAPHQVFPVASGPTEIAAADFTGDGWMDAAVTCYGDNHGQGTKVALLRNNGGSGFLAPVLLEVGPSPNDVVAGDLNNDGRTDMVVARNNYRLAVLINNGAGAFAPAVEYVTQEQNWAGDLWATVDLGDVDHDQDLDVFCSSNRTQYDSDYGAIVLFRNNGTGALVDRTAIRLPRYTGGCADLDVADTNGDAWVDILSAHAGSAGWVVTRSLGGASFEDGTEYTGGHTPMRIEATDVDLDGDPDALVLNRYSLTVGVHVNTGAGVFLEPDGQDLEPLCSYMDAGDIDKDGDLDVVSSFAYAGGGGLSVIRNQGDGTFSFRQNYTGPRGAMTPRFDDLDGDGDLDIVWAFDNTSPPYDFAVRLNNGTGTFGTATTWPVGTCGTGDLITMDVDQDGDRDVLLTDWLGCVGIESPWVWIRRNNGNATFGAPYVLTYDIDPKQMAAGDFNHDGREDLATVHANGIRIVMALGNGQFGTPAAYLTPDPSYALAAGDLNDDAYPDVVTANIRGAWEGTISVFLNRGNGTLGAPTTIRSAFSTDVSPIGQIRVQDVDLDGDEDVTMMSYGGQDLLVYENDGNGAMVLQNRYVAGPAPGDYRVADFTGDGRPDIGAVVGIPPSNLNRKFAVAAGIQMDPAGAEPPAAVPTSSAITLSGANPFADVTRLSFTTAARGSVRLTIHDAAGRRIRSLVDGVLGAGEHAVTWDGTDASGERLPAGVYIAHLQMELGQESGLRLVLAR